MEEKDLCEICEKRPAIDFHYETNEHLCRYCLDNYEEIKAERINEHKFDLYKESQGG